MKKTLMLLLMLIMPTLVFCEIYYRCDICGKEVKNCRKITMNCIEIKYLGTIHFPFLKEQNRTENNINKDICKDCFNKLSKTLLNGFSVYDSSEVMTTDFSGSYTRVYTTEHELKSIFLETK